METSRDDKEFKKTLSNFQEFCIATNVNNIKDQKYPLLSNSSPTHQND